MRVKSCLASDGAGHVIKLSDEFGCVLRPKMISRFLKARAPDERATVITYAFFHAFKFPDALSVHIKCKVEICRHGCLDHCQLTGGIHERKDVIDDADVATSNEINSFLHEPNHSLNNHDADDLQDLSESNLKNQEEDADDAGEDYYDIIHRGNEYHHLGLTNKHETEQTPSNNPDSAAQQQASETKKEEFEQLMTGEILSQSHSGPHSDEKTMEEKFPHGPRYFEAQNRMGKPAVAGPRSLDLDKVVEATTKRKKRSIKVRSSRSADVGVSGIYDVISEADLAFSLDSKQESVTVFQVRNFTGRISGLYFYFVVKVRKYCNCQSMFRSLPNKIQI